MLERNFIGLERKLAAPEVPVTLLMLSGRENDLFILFFRASFRFVRYETGGGGGGGGTEGALMCSLF